MPPITVPFGALSCQFSCAFTHPCTNTPLPKVSSSTPIRKKKQASMCIRNRMTNSVNPMFRYLLRRIIHQIQNRGKFQLISELL